MAHHVFRRAIFAAGGLLDWIVANLDPLFLLGFDDEVGSSIFADSSGNGNDFTINGTPTLEAGESTLFSGAGQSMDIDASAERGTRDGVATTDDSWSIVGIYTVETTNTSLRIYDNILDSGASTARCLFYQFSGTMRCTWPSAFTSTTARAINADGWSGLIGLVASGTEGAFYENGIEYARFTVTTGAQLGGATRTVGWGDYALAGANPALGKHSLGLLADKAMTRLDHYNLWKEATGGLTHYWYETLGSLSGATAATATSPALPPSSCVFHAPLWDTAGAQAIDVSGNENHGTFVGGPTLAQTPLGDNAVYSVALNGSTQYLDATAALVDYAAADFTASVRFTATASLDAVFSMGASTSQYITAITSGTSLLVRVYDGAVLKTITFASVADGAVRDLVVRWDQSALELAAWVDGVAGTPQIATGLSAITPTLCRFGGAIASGTAPLLGSIEVPTIFNEALSDADCIILSGG